MARPGGDRIKELSNTSGTGSFVLAGAVSGEGVRAFSAAEDGQVIRYGAKHVTADEGESGYGVYTHATRTLTRLYRYYPTLGGSAVSFSAGGVHIVCSAISGDFLPDIVASDPTVNDDITTGYLQGHIRINPSTPSVWYCANHTDGAAVWVRLDGGGGGGGGLEVVDDSATSVTLDTNDDGLLRNMTSDSSIAATLAATTPVGTHFGISKGGSGLITVSCAGGAGYFTAGDDQGNAAATASFTVRGWAEFRCIANSGGSAAKYVVDGAGLSLPSIVTGLVDFTSAGIKIPNGAAVSGSLTVAAHGGGIYKTAGNCTIVPSLGFTVTLLLTGAHTIGAGGAAHSPASGDVVSVMCFGTANGDIKLAKTLAASVVNLPTA